MLGAHPSGATRQAATVQRWSTSSFAKGLAVHISKFRLIVGGVVTATSFSVLGAGTAYAVQFHMIDARKNLQQGPSDLQQAEPDKGGHRDQAINLV
jgi:hypothetical protein